MSTHMSTHTHTLAHIVQLEIGLQLTFGKGKKTHSQGVSEGEREREGKGELVVELFLLPAPEYRHNNIMLQLPRRRDRCCNCLLSERERGGVGEWGLAKDNMM